MEFKTPCLVAVYGTLRKNNGNHRIIENCEFLGEFRTDPEFKMLSLGGFPGIFLKGKNTITCEIYKIEDQNILKRLDNLEGYPTFYNRTKINTPYGKAWIYFLEEKGRYSSLEEIENGDWNSYSNEKNSKYY